MCFKQGQRVKVNCSGKILTGVVVYQRMAPPDYKEAEAVSVYLDSKCNDSKYVGSIFWAKDVSLED